MKTILTRYHFTKNQTIGLLNIFDGSGLLFTCFILELSFLDNQVRKSCIPTGTYVLKKRISPKFGLSFILENVVDRSYILIHSGNYHTHTKGCLLTGNKLVDINNDGLLDVVNSKDTLDEMLQILPDESKITICTAS